jgi:hypothetical protein
MTATSVSIPRTTDISLLENSRLPFESTQPSFSFGTGGNFFNDKLADG